MAEYTMFLTIQAKKKSTERPEFHAPLKESPCPHPQPCLVAYRSFHLKNISVKLEEKGYLIIRNVLSKAEVETLISAGDKLIKSNIQRNRQCSEDGTYDGFRNCIAMDPAFLPLLTIPWRSGCGATAEPAITDTNESSDLQIPR